MSAATFNLPNIARVVLASEVDRDNVSMPYFSEGLRYAILLTEAMLPLLNTEFPISISAFNTSKDSGLFYLDDISGNAAKIMSHPVAGGPMLYIGKRDDFEFPSRLANDTLEPICFEESEIFDYAKQLAEYFNTGK